MRAQIVGNPEIRDPKWSTKDGRPSEGKYAIFPLCESDEQNNLVFVGTAFFVCTNGVFLTAKHVVMDRRGKRPIDPLTAIQFTEAGHYLLRPVRHISINTTDVAMGVLHPATYGSTNEAVLNPILTLTTKVPPVGSIVTTFAYPKTYIKDEDSMREMHFETVLAFWFCAGVFAPRSRSSHASWPMLSNNDGYLPRSVRWAGNEHECQSVRNK